MIRNDKNFFMKKVSFVRYVEKEVIIVFDFVVFILKY